MKKMRASSSLIFELHRRLKQAEQALPRVPHFTIPESFSSTRLSRYTYSLPLLKHGVMMANQPSRIAGANSCYASSAHEDMELYCPVGVFEHFK